MTLRDLQQSISNWGRATFGHQGVKVIASRMNIEVAELLLALENLPAEGTPRARALLEAGRECADIQIMLVQIADALRELGLAQDLQDLTKDKMRINEGRTWETGPTGKVQHVEPPAAMSQKYIVAWRDNQPFPGTGVETFVEETSGATLELSKFYLMWDAGGLVLKRGFDTVEEALEAAKASGYTVDLVVPKFLGWDNGWEGSGWINVMKGEDLYMHAAAYHPDTVREGEPA